MNGDGPRRVANEVVTAVLVALALALLNATWQLYTDVQELKIRFNYVHGDWQAPPPARGRIER